jgi:hypothetical protein
LRYSVTKGEEEGGESQEMKPEIPPSIDPGGFFGGRRHGFLIVTLVRSSLKGVVELEKIRVKGKGS